MATKQPSIPDPIKSKYATWKGKRKNYVYGHPSTNSPLSLLTRAITYRDKMGPPVNPQPVEITGVLELEWDLPSRLHGQNIPDWIPPNGTLTIQNDQVIFGRLDQQVKEFYGCNGPSIINMLVYVLEDPRECYSNSMIYPQNLIHICFSINHTDAQRAATSFPETLRTTLAWICLLKQNEVSGSIAI